MILKKSLLLAILLILVLIFSGCSEREQRDDDYQLALALKSEDGAGGELIVNNKTIDDDTFNDNYTENSEVSLEVQPDERSEFIGWRYQGSNELISTRARKKIMMIEDAYLFAEVGLNSEAKIDSLAIELEKEEVNVPEENEREEIRYRIIAKDEAGDKIEGLNLKLATKEDLAGITIEEDKIILSSNAIELMTNSDQPDSREVEFELETINQTAQKSIMLISEAPEPSGVSIVGRREIVVPTKDEAQNPRRSDYSAQMADQYGRIYDDDRLEDVEWSVDADNLIGVEIDQTGIVSITHEAAQLAGGRISLKAMKDGHGGIRVIDLKTNPARVSQLELDLVDEEIKVPKTDTLIRKKYASLVEAKDQYGRDIDDEIDLEWSIIDQPTGIEIDNNGQLEINYQAGEYALENDDFVIELKAGNSSIRESIKLDLDYQTAVGRDGVAASGGDYMNNLEYVKSVGDFYLNINWDNYPTSNSDQSNHLFILINNPEYDSNFEYEWRKDDTRFTTGWGEEPYDIDFDSFNFRFNTVVWGWVSVGGSNVDKPLGKFSFGPDEGANKIVNKTGEEPNYKTENYSSKVSLVQDIEVDKNLQLRIPYEAITGDVDRTTELEIIIVFGKVGRGNIVCTLPYKTDWGELEDNDLVWGDGNTDPQVKIEYPAILK